LPKVLIKQENEDGTATVVYEGEKNSVVLMTGDSPWVYHTKVEGKDKMFDELRELKEE